MTATPPPAHDVTHVLGHDTEHDGSGRLHGMPDVVGKAITEVASPVVIASLTLVGDGLHTSATWAGAGQGLLAATFACLIPLAAVLVLVRRQRLTDHHVRLRSQRALPLGIGIACTVTGILALTLVHAPAELVKVTVTMLAGLAVALVISLRWKASIHVAVASGAVSVGCVLGGLWWLLAAPLVIVIAWARVRVRDHTVAQTIGGAAFGSATTVVVLTALLAAS